MQAILEDVTSRLKDLFGNGLLSVVLYGSAVRGTYRKGVSDINILVLVEESRPQEFFEMGRVLKPFLRKHRLNPKVMTRDEFASSADVFPLEYSDIKDAHKVLYGDEGILNIDLRSAHLCYELEEKLKGAVGDIRYLLIASGGNEKKLAMHLGSWSGLCGTIFRGLLRLKGVSDIPAEADALYERVSAEYSVPMDGFSALERFRKGEKPSTEAVPIGTASAVELTEPLLCAMKALTRAVYAMTRRSGEPE